MAKASTGELRQRRSSGKKSAAQKSKAGGKLYPLSMRTTHEVRKRLEEAAAKNGRSLASEVEERLLASFTRERRESEIASQAIGGIHASFGGEEAFKWLRLLSQWATKAIGPDWHKENESMHKAFGTWKFLVELLVGLPTDLTKPRKPIELNPFLFDDFEKEGIKAAAKMLQSQQAEKTAAERD